MEGQAMAFIQSVLRLFIENIADVKRFGWRFLLRYPAAAIGKKTVNVRIRDFGNINIRTKSTDAEVVRQIFRFKDYEMTGFSQIKKVQNRYDELSRLGFIPIIIDAGANIGASAIWFAKQFPQAKILAIEPDTENAACCRINVKRFSNVETIEAAIGSSSGFALLKNESGEAWTVQTERVNKKEGVKIFTVKELLAPFPSGRLFIIKIDIEGFESDLFERDTAWLDEVTAVFIEPHDWLFPGKGSSLTFQKAIASRNFEILLKGENLIYISM
jgi:FkbM family methyltransferase